MIAVVVFLIAIVLLVIFIDKESSPEKDSFFEKVEEFKQKNETNETSNNSDSVKECFNESCYSVNGSSGVMSGGSGGGSGGSSGDSEDILDSPNENLPEDINTSNCGLYYEKYGACKGTCPEGRCVRGGPRNESCYCQPI